jgi:hypothetical protein
MVISVLAFPVHPFGLSQPLADEVHVPGRCRDASLRFLLESVQNVDRFREPNGIDGPPRATAILSDNLNHRGSAIDLSLLRGIERLADVAPDFPGKGTQIFPA